MGYSILKIIPVFFMILSFSSMAEGRKITDCHKFECNGDGLWRVKTNTYTREYNAGNSFGKVNSDINSNLEIEFSQYYSQYLRPYFHFGTSYITYKTPWLDYSNRLYYSSLGLEINPVNFIKLNASSSYGPDVFLREYDGLPYFHKSKVLSTNLGADISIFKDGNVDFGVGASVISMSGSNDFLKEGRGHSQKIFINKRSGNFTIGSGVLIRTLSFKIDGTEQKISEAGLILNLGFSFPFDENN